MSRLHKRSVNSHSYFQWERTTFDPPLRMESKSLNQFQRVCHSHGFSNLNSVYCANTVRQARTYRGRVGWTRSAHHRYRSQTVAYSSLCLCQSSWWTFRAQTACNLLYHSSCTYVIAKYRDINTNDYRTAYSLHMLSWPGFWITIL